MHYRSSLRNVKLEIKEGRPDMQALHSDNSGQGVIDGDAG